MQRLHRDLWDGWSKRYGDSATLCAFEGKRFRKLRMPLFVFRALWEGIAAGKRGTHIHLGDASLAPVARFIKRFTQASVSMNVHGLDIMYPASLYQWLLRRTLPSIDSIVCNSASTAQILYERGWTGKTTVIPCGIHPQFSVRKNPPSNPVRLLSIGRLVARKGVAWFIAEVLPLLLKDHSNLVYTVVGAGSEESRIGEVIRTKGLGQSVRMAGEVGDAERNRLIDESHLVVVPNIPRDGDSEGFGIICIEASSRGVPVMASRLEGLQDAVIDGQTGRFFVPTNARNCSQVIDQMLNESWDPSRVSSVTNAHFGWQKLLDQYHAVIFS
jgi:phosphatidylinositol alpha-1,6-mannosyltransferase